MDTREKLILKSAKDCTLCNEALESAFDECGGMSASEFAKELSQAITIKAGVELFTQNAIKLRLSKMGASVAETQSASGYAKENKTAKATAVVNALTKQFKDPKMLQDNIDLVQSMADDAADDTVTSMLVDTEINDRITSAFKIIDNAIGAWEVSGKKFWLDMDYIKLNLERIQRKVRDCEETS